MLAWMVGCLNSRPLMDLRTNCFATVARWFVAEKAFGERCFANNAFAD
jgi:hypothetical protein